MKPQQNNFTTPEQSKRLLELGVPTNSADCYFFDWTAKFKVCARDVLPENMTYEEMIMQPDTFNEVHQDRFLPCWSVGRLMEIWEICTEEKWERTTSGPIIDELVSDYVVNKLDFSKLED